MAAMRQQPRCWCAYAFCTLLKLQLTPSCQGKGIICRLLVIKLCSRRHDKPCFVDQPYCTAYMELRDKDQELLRENGIDKRSLHMGRSAPRHLHDSVAMGKVTQKEQDKGVGNDGLEDIVLTCQRKSLAMSQ